ncbi:uncharacterized protein LOC100114341 [Nasonia vitripennis]|uniref:CCHC-type domain-containing protein n=1 Tax=Nasonia vitripennis TaxID=7425 RepID=A0A7M7Q1B0_NASVI|nr:uncharacterized protein LOC100114341 [Nasonia vitripennis]
MDETEIEITEPNYEDYEASDVEDEFKSHDLSPFHSPSLSDRRKMGVLSVLRSIKENQEKQNDMMSQVITLLEGQQKITNKLLEIEKAKIRSQISKKSVNKELDADVETSEPQTVQSTIISQLNETFRNLKQSLESNSTSKLNIQRDYKLTEKALNLLDCINPDLKSNDLLDEEDDNIPKEENLISKESETKEFKNRNADDFHKGPKGSFPPKRTQWHVGPTQRCFRCNKIGHNAPECPLAEYGLWFCYFCQAEKKHKGSDCPRSNAGTSKTPYFGNKKYIPNNPQNKYIKNREYDNGGRERANLSKPFKRTVKPEIPGRNHNQYYKPKDAKPYMADSEETSWKRKDYNNY